MLLKSELIKSKKEKKIVKNMDDSISEATNKTERNINDKIGIMFEKKLSTDIKSKKKVTNKKDEPANVSEVTVLDDKIEKNKSQAVDILPEWIVNCVKIENVIKNSVSISDEFNIRIEIKNCLENFQINKLFPVQFTVIPAILNSWKTINTFRPHDICVCAPTGSGKTLAYVIPILQLLSQSTENHIGPRAIVVLPVRDLASQVYEVFKSLSKCLGIKCSLITGYKNLSKEREDLLEKIDGEVVSKTDIIICTPGRLVEHIKNTKDLNLSCIQHLVIDEADRVLEDPKHDWFLTLTKHIGLNKRFKDIQSSFLQQSSSIIQKILLSATLTRQPHLLEHFDLHFPKLFVVGGKSPENRSVGDLDELHYSAPEGLKEFFVVYNKEYCRIIFIVDQIRRLKMSHILCFTNTKESAARLNQLLNQFTNIRSSHLHCEQPPEIRHKLRKSLESGSIDILVTVDSMGRGMDIVGVKCVIQYDMKTDVSTYIHRVGRTARGGQNGQAYTLVSPTQIFHLKKNLTKCGRSIKPYKFSQGKSFKYLNEYNAALSKLQNNIENNNAAEMVE